MDLEAIVCKRKDSPYKVTEKPSRYWIKVKNPEVQPIRRTRGIVRAQISKHKNTTSLDRILLQNLASIKRQKTFAICGFPRPELVPDFQNESQLCMLNFFAAIHGSDFFPLFANVAVIIARLRNAYLITARRIVDTKH